MMPPKGYEQLLLWQYKTQPNALATAKLLAETLENAWRGIISLPLALSIEDAEGINLDIIGKHVGQSRILSSFYPRALFGFANALNAQGFKRLSQANGGRWYRVRDSLKESVRLSDLDYRFLIKCRISKNYQLGTIDDVSAMLEFIFGSGSVAYDNFDMTLSVLIETNSLTTFKRYIIKELDILPRPVGVGIKYYFARPENAFGFYRAPSAQGFNQGIFTRFI